VAVTFVANSNLTNVDVSVVPELRPFLSVSPSHFDQLSMNTTTSLTITVSIAEAAISQVYTGTIQFRNSPSGSVFARPLPVALLVQAPTFNSIPDGVALPSTDRFVTDRGIELAKDEVIIFADPAATQSQIVSLAARFGAAFLGHDSGLQFYQLQLGAQNLDAVLALVSQLGNDPIVKLATPHYFLSATTPTFPNDPSWDLFGIFNICPTAPRYCESWAQALIQLPDAWSVKSGSSSVKIAIVDQGFDPNHEDLKVDNVLSDVQFSVDPYRAHGTAVASLAAATGDNGKGLAGAMWPSDLLLFGCSNGVNDRLDEPTCWKKAREAIDNGARIINASLGHNFSPICDGVSPLSDAERQQVFDTDASGWRMVVDYATVTPGGVLFVFTAGNDATSFGWQSPGVLSADNPNLTTCGNCAVISVGAVDRNSNQASYSSFGSRDMNGNGIPLTVWAPGGDTKFPMCPGGTRMSNFSDSLFDPLNKLPFTTIWSAEPGNSYGYGEAGTSLAAPFVSGVAGLMLSVNPNLTATQLKTMIHDTAAVIGQDSGGNEIRLLNAFRAVQRAQTPPSVIISVTGPNNAAGGLNVGAEAIAMSWSQSSSHASVTISANIMGVNTQTVTAYLTTQIGPTTTTANEIARATVVFPGWNNYTNVVLLNIRNLPAGTYYLTLSADGDSSCTIQTVCSPGAWAGTTLPSIAAGAGVSANGSYYTPLNPPGFAAYPPASSFKVDTFQSFLFTVAGQ